MNEWLPMNAVLLVVAIAGYLWARRDKRRHYREQAEKRIRTFQGSVK